MPNPANPQSLNRYSYCLNNPLRYIDPSGHDWMDIAVAGWLSMQIATAMVANSTTIGLIRDYFVTAMHIP